MKKRFLALGLTIALLATLGINLYLSSTSGNLQGSLKINLIINIGSREETKTIELKNGSTVFEALNSTFPIEYKDYGGMGKLIFSIEGYRQNQTHYWSYYVNDKYAEVATDRYYLINDSTVLFNYTPNNALTAV